MINKMNRFASFSALRQFRRGQTGTAALEFALIFPVLFLFTYGTIAYGFAFYVQQTLNFMAEEAVRAAISVDPSSGDGTTGTYQSNAKSKALASISNYQSVILSKPILNAAPSVTFPNGGVQVTLNAPLASLGIVTFKVPLIGQFPVMPATFTASATAQLQP
jgi:Flp pilus assembly protein TadG